MEGESEKQREESQRGLEGTWGGTEQGRAADTAGAGSQQCSLHSLLGKELGHSPWTDSNCLTFHLGAVIQPLGPQPHRARSFPSVAVTYFKH